MLGYLGLAMLGRALLQRYPHHGHAHHIGVCGTAAARAGPLPYALIWLNHIGVDRLLGYGLKYPAGFGWTHLGKQGKAAQSIYCCAVRLALHFGHERPHHQRCAKANKPRPDD